ncbi:MAG: acyltransferase family protein [Clostridiales bacterium]|nr:acyltransferase family protein [Clostridiales bacterium]
MEANTRDPGLDVVRSLAIVFVLVIHTAGAGLTQTPGSFDWWGALLWGAPARPAVPLFFMCSGALMLCRDITPRRIFTHNMPRILCAMFAWAFLYRLAALLDDGFTMAGLWDAVKRTVLFQHEFHFYYLHMLILVYAFLPVAWVFVRSASRRELEYLLGLWMITGILIPTLINFWPFTLVEPLELRYKMGKAYSCIGYALLGHYLRQYGGSIKRRWYALALLAGLAVTFGGCAALSLRGGALNDIFLEGMSPGPMLTALGLFGLVITRKEWPAPVVKVTGRLARASFCIYLVHVLFQRLFLRLGVSAGASPCVLSIPFVCLLLLAAGWLTWEVLHRIPIVKTYLV